MTVRNTRIETRDTAREIPGLPDLNLKYANRLAPESYRWTFVFILLTALSSGFAVFLTRCFGIFFPFVAVGLLAILTKVSTIDSRRFVSFRPDILSALFYIVSLLTFPVSFVFFVNGLRLPYQVPEPIVSQLTTTSNLGLFVVCIFVGVVAFAREFSWVHGAKAFAYCLSALALFNLTRLPLPPGIRFLVFGGVLALLGSVVCNRILRVYLQFRGIQLNDVHRFSATSIGCVAIVLLLGAVLIQAIFQFSTVKPTGLCLATLLAICLSASALCLAISQRLTAQQFSIGEMLRHSGKAIAVWCNYSPHYSAAGVYRPMGVWQNVWIRRFSIAALFFISSACLLPTASYFPTTLSNSTAWHENARARAERMRPNAVNEKIMFGATIPPFQFTSSDSLKQINSSPESWLFLALDGFTHAKPFFWISLLISLLLSAASVLCFTSLPFGLAALSQFEYFREIETSDNATEESDNDSWNEIVTTIQTSQDTTERNSLFLGFHDAAGYPVLMPREALREHGHILGDTGSGKTAMGFAPLITQLIRMSGRDKKETPVESRQSSIVVIDLKGDPALFEGAQVEAKQAGLPFKFFTNQRDQSTHVFNPFLQNHLPFVKNDEPKLSKDQWVEKITECLDLYHGEGYGRGHFSELNKDIISVLLDTFTIRSFRDLAAYSKPDKRELLGKKLKIKQNKIDQAASAFAAISRVAKIEALNAVPGETRFPKDIFKKRIDMSEPFKRPMVIYFYLRSALEPSNARSVALLAMQSLLTAAACQPTSQANTNQVYLFVDEFQQVASENLSIVLKQARSMNIAAVLAHQTLSDLLMNEVDLTPVIQANTRFKQLFAATDLGFQEAVVKSSGEYYTDEMMLAKTTFFVSPNSNDDLIQDFAHGPRITQNDVIRMSDDPAKSIIQLPRGAGYARFGGFPFIARGSFHISSEEYERRANCDWPKNAPGTFVPTDSAEDTESTSTEPVVDNGKRNIAPSSQPSGIIDKLKSLDKKAKAKQGKRRQK